MDFRSAYSRRVRVAVEPVGETRTRQSEADSCDINRIVARARKGYVPPMRGGSFFADVAKVGDYFDSMQRLTQARDLFMTLPAEVRKRFGNEPGELIAFAEDPKNGPELRKLFGEPEPKPAAPDPKPASPDPGGDKPPVAPSGSKA